MKHFQGTLNKVVNFAGVGLHSGNLVNIEVLPACQNTGIIFQRVDEGYSAPILAHPFNVSTTDLNTTIGEGDCSISTIEHLMAAFAFMGIDNAYVKVDAPELPILDGSSAPFVDKFRQVGVVKQKARRKLLIVNQPFEVRSGDQFVKVEPHPYFSVNCHIDFKNSTAIGQQSLDFNFLDDDVSKLCDARTFCHINDVNAMRKAGLARGGSLDNAIVVNDSDVINSEGLRYRDEFVRHKLLDFIGDAALLGGQLIGKVYLKKAGHKLHSQFTQALLKHQSELLSVVVDDDWNKEFRVVDSNKRMKPVSLVAQTAFGHS